MSNSENGPILNSGKIWEERMLSDIEELKENRLAQLLNEDEGINEQD